MSRTKFANDPYPVGRPSRERDDIMAWLPVITAKPILASVIKARTPGSWSTTLKAKKALGIKSKQIAGQWYWYLPKSDDLASQLAAYLTEHLTKLLIDFWVTHSPGELGQPTQPIAQSVQAVQLSDPYDDNAVYSADERAADEAEAARIAQSAQPARVAQPALAEQEEDEPPIYTKDMIAYVKFWNTHGEDEEEMAAQLIKDARQWPTTPAYPVSYIKAVVEATLCNKPPPPVPAGIIEPESE